MVELEEVQLSKNTITAIPPLGGLTSLKSFTINNNSLTEIPESIGKCAALEEFAAASNSIAAVPERLVHARPLIEAYFPVYVYGIVFFSFRDVVLESPQGMHHLPLLSHCFCSVGDLPELQKIVVSQNKITSIPQSLIQVKTLATIDFADNQLTEVPEGVSSLPSLTNLFVQVAATPNTHKLSL